MDCQSSILLDISMTAENLPDIQNPVIRRQGFESLESIQKLTSRFSIKSVSFFNKVGVK